MLTGGINDRQKDQIEEQNKIEEKKKKKSRCNPAGWKHSKKPGGKNDVLRNLQESAPRKSEPNCAAAMNFPALKFKRGHALDRPSKL